MTTIQEVTAMINALETAIDIIDAEYDKLSQEKQASGLLRAARLVSDLTISIKVLHRALLNNTDTDAIVELVESQQLRRRLYAIEMINEVTSDHLIDNIVDAAHGSGRYSTVELEAIRKAAVDRRAVLQEKYNVDNENI